MQAVFSLTNVSYRQIITIPVLEIPASSLFSITGKSGSGKTTLLKLFNNLISCEEGGTVFYYGQNVLNIDPVSLRRRVVMIPQSPFIFPGTVRENIRLAFHFNRKEVPEQGVIENLLNQLDLPGFIDKDTLRILLTCPGEKSSAWPWLVPCCLTLKRCCLTNQLQRSMLGMLKRSSNT